MIWALSFEIRLENEDAQVIAMITAVMKKYTNDPFQTSGGAILQSSQICRKYRANEVSLKY
jgi:hypothetical protein